MKVKKSIFLLLMYNNSSNIIMKDLYSYIRRKTQVTTEIAICWVKDTVCFSRDTTWWVRLYMYMWSDHQSLECGREWEWNERKKKDIKVTDHTACHTNLVAQFTEQSSFFAAKSDEKHPGDDSCTINCHYITGEDINFTERHDHNSVMGSNVHPELS